jgi:hypothetical protein
LKTDFDPLSVNRRVCGNFVNYRGVISQPSTPLTAENVVNDFVDFDLADLRFRDPDNFLAGNLHDHCQIPILEYPAKSFVFFPQIHFQGL